MKKNINWDDVWFRIWERECAGISESWEPQFLELDAKLAHPSNGS